MSRPEVRAGSATDAPRSAARSDLPAASRLPLQEAEGIHHKPTTAPTHKFLIHRRGDHVGVATSDIGAGETVLGIFLDDDSAIEVQAKAAIPLGHKIAIGARGPGEPVTEYGIQIGVAPEGLEAGDYVHTHNLKSARW